MLVLLCYQHSASKSNLLLQKKMHVVLFQQKKKITHDKMLTKAVTDNVSDIFSDSEDSVIKRRQNKTVYPFLDYNESDSSDDENNDI